MTPVNGPDLPRRPIRHLCDSRMTAGQTRKVFRYYRCPNPDCRARAVISVANVEPVVVEAVKAAAANEEGRASVESGAAAIEAERARAKYDAAVEALDAFSDTAAVKKKLRDLLTKAEAAEERAERADQLGSRREIVRPAKDWDRLSLSLSLDAQREIIQAVVERVVVSPGRGPERVRVELVGE